MVSYVAASALVLGCVALLAAYLALRTLARLRRASVALARGASSRESLIETTLRHDHVLDDLVDRMAAVALRLDDVRVEAIAHRHADRDAAEEQIATLRADVAGAIRNVALVRFDASSEVTGQQSFALALLDDCGAGAVVTSVVGRGGDARLDAKPLSAGVQERGLTPHEKRAVAAACPEAGDPVDERRAG